MKCPFCGSPESWYSGIYDCQSVRYDGVTLEHMRGEHCLRNERDRLKIKIMRLYAAGDVLYSLLDPPSPCMRTTEYDNALQGWDDEKGRP